MVITIIGILIGLLLPAVQGVRESVRRITCMNNLRQMSLACLSHEVVQGFFPTGGWFYRYAGDPNQGFTSSQPGGWSYNILPYMDQKALHDMGKGSPPGVNDLQDTQRRQLGAQMAATPVAIFCCPSRRRAAAYKYKPPGEAYCADWDFHNIDDPPLIANRLCGQWRRLPGRQHRLGSGRRAGRGVLYRGPRHSKLSVGLLLSHPERNGRDLPPQHDPLKPASARCDLYVLEGVLKLN